MLLKVHYNEENMKTEIFPKSFRQKNKTTNKEYMYKCFVY